MKILTLGMLSMDELFIYNLVVSFAAALFHGVLGFGFPLIATPLISIFGSVQTAVIATLFPTLAVNIMSISTVKKGWHFIGRYWILGLSIVFGSWLGTQLLAMHSSPIYKIILASAILFYLAQKYFGISFKFILNENLIVKIVFGFSAGLVGGLVNVMTPFMVMYVIEKRLQKAEGIALMNFSFLANKITQITTFSFLGFLGEEVWLFAGVSVVIAIIALMIGKRIHNLIDTKLYEKILKSALIVMSLVLIVQSIQEFIT